MTSLSSPKKWDVWSEKVKSTRGLREESLREMKLQSSGENSGLLLWECDDKDRGQAAMNPYLVT